MCTTLTDSPQMMYDPSGGGATLRTYNSVNLAWWNSYKHVCFKIWARFGNSIFAPLWHHLYPANAFFPKPSSFPSVQKHLLYLHMCADDVRPEITSLLARVDPPPKQTKMLKDLQFLLDVAIPVVMHTALSLPHVHTHRPCYHTHHTYFPYRAWTMVFRCAWEMGTLLSVCL